MSFEEIAAGAVVLFVVAGVAMNRSRRGANRGIANDAGRTEFEAIVEQRGGQAAASGLRALLEAAREAKTGATGIEVVSAGSRSADLGALLEAARARKTGTHQHRDASPQTTGVASSYAARPPIGALPVRPSLKTMRPMSERAPLPPLTAIVTR